MTNKEKSLSNLICVATSNYPEIYYTRIVVKDTKIMK